MCWLNFYNTVIFIFTDDYDPDDEDDYPVYRNDIPSSQKPLKNAVIGESSASLVHLVKILYLVTLVICISLL